MAFIICGVAILAIVFFLLGVACKGMASAVNSAVETIIMGIAIAVLGILLIGVLWLVYLIGYAIIEARILEVLELLIALVIGAVLVIMFGGWLGIVVLEIAVSVAITVVQILSVLLETAAIACENAYAYFLNILVKQLEKC